MCAGYVYVHTLSPFPSYCHHFPHFSLPLSSPLPSPLLPLSRPLPPLYVVFAMFGMLSPASRGALMTAAIVLFMFMGLVAGYNGARMYRTLKGTHWKRAAGLTASLYPGVVFGVGFFLNFFIWGKHSSGAVSQQTGMLCGRLVGVRGGRILWVVWARRVYLRTLCRYFLYHCSGILFTEKLLLSVVHLSHPLPFPSPFLLSSLFFHFFLFSPI